VSDIVERLRAMNPWTDMDWPEVKNEAAEEITALRARIDKLEKALQPFVRDIENWTDDDGWAPYAPSMDRIRDWFGPSDFRSARAALTEANG